MQENQKLGVVIADDEPVICESIAQEVEQDGDFMVLACAADGVQALEAVRRYNPAILITDIKMPRMGGLDLVKQLSRTDPTVHTVIVSGYADFEFARTAMRYGVFNYLLKPLDRDVLRETLQELKSDLLRAKQRPQKKVLYSEGYQPMRPQAVRYRLFVLCVGNLYSEAGGMALREALAKPLSGLEWRGLLGRLFPDCDDWYLADEDDPNQKLLCIAQPQGQDDCVESLAQGLLEMLRSTCPEQPVHLCASRQTFVQEDVWLCAQRMRNLLRQQLQVGRDQLLWLERDELNTQQELMNILQMRVSDQIRSAILHRDREMLDRELQMLLSYAIGNGIAQVNLQKLCQRVLHMSEYPAQPAQQTPETCYANLAVRLGLARRGEDVGGTVLRCVEAAFPAAKNAETEGDLMERVRAYLDQNYLHLQNLEELTAVFPYTYAYLSRQFTKRFSVSPNRYVLSRRMELAKRLIENNENMSLSEIGCMAGYADNHYFSKVFRSYTGMSPTEYRNAILPQG